MDNLDLLAEKIFLHFKEKKNRSYPLLLEKEEIKKELEMLKNNPNSFYLLDEADGEIQGICSYFIIEKEKYLQTTIFASLNHKKQFISDALNHLIDKYQEYTINVGVEAENILLINELMDKGFMIIDDLYSATVKPDILAGELYSDVESVDLSRWSDFKEVHQRCFAQGYWTFDRIKINFDIRKIYCIKKNSSIKAYIFVKSSPCDETCEIFGIYGDSIDDRLKLIEHSLASLKEKVLMYYFIEDYDEMEACKKLGFDIHGHYQAWEYKRKKTN